MTYITKIENIFRVLLDNLTKPIYNIISIVRSLALWRNFCLAALFLAVAFSGFTPIASADGGEVLSVRLDCFERNGKIELEISFPEGVDFCGFFCELLYDGEMLFFEGLMSRDDLPYDGELSFADAGGRVGILLDGDDSVFDGEGLTAVFSLQGELSGEICFDLVRADAYRWNGDMLCRLEVPPSFVAFVPDMAGADERGAPELLKFKVGDDGVAAVGYAPEGCFAAGFELAVVTVPSAELYRVTVAAVLPLFGGASEFELALLCVPLEGRACVILRPVVYSRDGATHGDEAVFLFIDGILYGEGPAA